MQHLFRKKLKVKKTARKSVTPSTSDSDYNASDQPHEDSGDDGGEDVHSDAERGYSPPPSPTYEVPVHDSVPSPPPSPTQTSVLITIAPCPPPVSTAPPVSSPIPLPIFSQATTKPSVNVSDTRAPTLQIEPPLSPSPSTESDTILGGEVLNFESTYYSPYRVQSDDDEDAPVTKRHLKDLHNKLDMLVASSYSSSSGYSEAAVKAILETVLNKHESSIQRATEAVDASTLLSKKAVDEVKSLIHNAKIFIESLQGAAETNSNKVNAIIESLSKLFRLNKRSLTRFVLRFKPIKHLFNPRLLLALKNCKRIWHLKIK